MTDLTSIFTEEGFSVISELGTGHAIDKDLIFLDNLRDVSIPTIRFHYNSIVYCKAGCIVVEMGNNQQIKVVPGQILLIPSEKPVQPMLISTDLDANALLISDKTLKTLLGNQANIWNKAMFMKETYVLEKTDWLLEMENYSSSLFKNKDNYLLFREILYSLIRTMLLMICEDLLQREKIDTKHDDSSIHDKDIFYQFLLLLSEQKQKRQKVSFYADKLHISAKYLSTITKKVSGKTPLRWITESVMEDCYTMLRDTNLSVKEISNQQGFPNSSFFGQYFREESGETPMAYRAKYKKNA